MGEDAAKLKRNKRKSSKSRKSSKHNVLDADDKYAKGGAGFGSKPVLVLVIVLVCAAVAMMRPSKEAGGASMNVKVSVEASLDASPNVEEKKSRKRRKKEVDTKLDDDEEGVNLDDVTFITSEHSSLGWTKTQGHLVAKRPPRECEIRYIEPQVTTPFFLLNKKNKWKRRIYTCLRHHKQECTSALLKDFEARRWKLKGTKLPLDNRLLSTFVITDSETLRALKESKPEVYNELMYVNEGSSYLNTIEGATALTGSLLEQFNARAAFAKEFGCPYNALKIQPPQFRYDVYSECQMMETAFGKHLRDSWLMTDFDDDLQSLKPGIAKDSSSLDGLGSFCKERAKVSSVTNSRALGSLLVPQPFKLQGKLFDVRGFLLIGSTLPMTAFFQQGYVRQAERGSAILSPFQFDGAGANDIRLDMFQHHLASSKITGSHYVDTFLQQSMKQIALFVFHAARPKIIRRKGSFQLFAIDYVIDKSFRVYLEKTSGSPDLDSVSRYDPRQMVADMHDLVQELHEVPVAFQGMVKGDKYGSWELIFSELSETCHRILYNPCHAFIDFNDKDLTKPNKKVGRVQATQKRLDNEAKRIVKKTEEKKKETCRAKHVPYPSTKCNHLIETMEHEEFQKLFKEHEESFNPNEFRLPRPGEVFPHEVV